LHTRDKDKLNGATKMSSKHEGEVVQDGIVDHVQAYRSQQIGMWRGEVVPKDLAILVPECHAENIQVPLDVTQGV
jgi:hypothetical protein